MKPVRALSSTLAAIIILSALVATSEATRISVSSQTFRAGFARWNFSGGFGTLECPLTLEGSYHSRTIAKSARDPTRIHHEGWFRRVRQGLGHNPNGITPVALQVRILYRHATEHSQDRRHHRRSAIPNKRTDLRHRMPSLRRHHEPYEWCHSR